MKWISIAGLLCFVIWACNNASKGNTETDQTDSVTPPANTMNIPSDSVNRMGDTSSYDRIQR